MQLKGRCICGDSVEGRVLFSPEALSFTGGVSNSGVITERRHPLEGQCLKDRIFVVPLLKGSAAAFWVIYRLALDKVGPLAFVIPEADSILIAACIMGNITLVDCLEADLRQVFSHNPLARIDATKGQIEV